MTIKPSRSIDDQINLLRARGMLFHDIDEASHFLKNISYYRLKGYWWDMQTDSVNHKFGAGYYFEDVIKRYNFDRHLRLILFDAIERIEIALRTKMIYFLSMAYSPTWYSREDLFTDNNRHAENFKHLLGEFKRSKEIFIKDHKKRYPDSEPESWKIMEIASLGTLSKFYKNLNHQLPEKALIAKEMGLNLQKELSSWLESIVYVRNIIAHHSRLWSRTMVKTPIEKIKNPPGKWLSEPLHEVQRKKPFLIISTMIYLCNKVTPGHHIILKIKKLLEDDTSIPIHKLGFLNDWNNQPLWS